MKKTILVLLAVALVGFAAAAGCVTAPAETASPEGIWFAPGVEEIVLCINPDGTYYFHGIENFAFGTYTVDGNKLSFSDPGATRMAGPGMEKDQVFFRLFTEIDSFKVENSRLSLLADGEEVLTFVVGIAGNWVTEDGFTLFLNADKTFAVTGPVNTYFGTYAVTIRGLEFTVEGNTLALGSEEDMRDEEFFLLLLDSSATYSVENSKLTFTDVWGNDLLTFTASHEGTYLALSGEEIVLHADGTFSGQAAVNTFKGTYEFADRKAVLKDFTMTKMAGSEEEMEAEAEFLENLAAAEYTLTFGGQFINAYDKNGDAVLSFTYIASE